MCDNSSDCCLVGLFYCDYIEILGVKLDYYCSLY